MIPELTKYIELKERGFTASEVLAIAREDGLDELKVILQVFNLSLREAKEILMTSSYLAFHEQLMDDLDKINEEMNLENQGGNS
jgi:hypothetical protein